MSYRTVSVARAILLAGSAAIFAIPAQAYAQDAEEVAAEANDQASEAAQESGEIVVTARRRAEALQDVPIAVTAYSGAQLEREGAIDITDVGDTTPNVTLETSRGTNTTLTAFIRGVGQQDPVAGFEQGVGIYLDDVYLNRPQGAVLDIYDVERIEVLRGPQGTLYGRNTIGGAIKYVTRRLPDDPEVRVRANVGTYGQADLIVSGSGSLTDGFRFGASAARLSRNGFGENLTTGDENYNKDIWAVRGTMEMEPSDAIFFRLSGDYTWDDSDARGGHRLIPGLESGAPVLDDEFDTRGGLADPKQKVRGGGIAGHLTWNIADGYSFKSISAWRRSKSHTPIDFDALPSIDVDVPAIYEDSQFSQEVQLEIDRGPLAGIVGAYYLDANAANVFDVRLYTSCPIVPRPGCVIALPGLTAVTQGDVDTKTWAIFGDFTYDITDQWSVSVGGRYTEDKRHAKVFRANYVFGGQPALGGDGGFGTGVQAGAATSNFDGKRKDTAFTPRASISFKPNDNHNIYLSYSRGFKGGGFDPRGQSSNAPGDNANTPPTADQIYDFMAFDPETVNSYELGWKGALFDKRLRMAVALFRANYKDVQVPGSSPCTVLVLGVPTSSFCGITTNAGKARFQGVEVEANWAVAEDLATAGDRLNLSGSLGFLDAEYREFLTVMNLTEDLVPMPATTVDMADFRDVQNTPKWTLSGTVNYDTPLASGRLNVNSTLSYRSKSQQFEIATPGIDENGFALLDASIVWRSAGDHWSIGLHGKNLTDTKYITAGYNFLAQNPYTGEYIGNGAPPGPALGVPGYDAALGREGVLTAFYGNPRQIFLSLGAKF